MVNLTVADKTALEKFERLSAAFGELEDWYDEDYDGASASLAKIKYATDKVNKIFGELVNAELAVQLGGGDPELVANLYTQLATWRDRVTLEPVIDFSA